MCCFSDHSQTHFRGSGEIKITGKTGEILHENANVLKICLLLKKIFSVCPNFPDFF